MNEELYLVRLNTGYCDYLRQFDNKVPYNFKDKKLRPFIEVLFKIDNGRLGAINFNNMLPVMSDNIIVLDMNKECKSKNEERYMKLLSEQLRWLNRNSIKLCD